MSEAKRGPANSSLDLPEGFKMTELGPLPEDWEVVRLGNAVLHNRTTIDPQSCPGEVFEYFSIPAYQVSDKAVLELGSNIRSHKLLVEPGTALFGKLNPRVPKVWRVASASSNRKIASTEFIALVPIDGKTDADFLYYLAWSHYVLSKSQEMVSGSTPSRQRVDVKAFLKTTIPLPPLPEQKAIARVLRTVQQAKEATERVIQATRELKRSLMRYLFTYGPVPVDEADKVPLKETEIGPVPEHWDVVRLGEVAETTSGGTPSRKHPEYFGGKIPWVKSGELSDNLIRCTEESLTDAGLLNSNAKVFPKGTLLIAMYGATAGKVGILACEAATNQAVCAIFPGRLRKYLTPTLPGPPARPRAGTCGASSTASWAPTLRPACRRWCRTSCAF